MFDITANGIIIHGLSFRMYTADEDGDNDSIVDIYTVEGGYEQNDPKWTKIARKPFN